MILLEKAKASSELDGVVSSASVFISHAWQYKFLDVLDALKDHFKDDPDKIIWFDPMSNNQHKAKEYTFEWWATKAKAGIQQLGHTVMVIIPWSDPIAYKRAWNIFEAYCTYDANGKFEIALSAEERKLRDWVLTVGLEELKQAEHDSPNEIELMYLVGCIYKDQGNYKEAEPLYLECVSKCKELHGPNDSQTVSAMNNLAGLYSIQGKYEEASQLYRVAALSKDGMSHEVNKFNTVTLTSIKSYAGLYQSDMNIDPRDIEGEICCTDKERFEPTLDNEGRENTVKLHAYSTQADNQILASTESIPFPTNGIKLSYLLNQFVDDRGGREALKDLTTEQICNQFVKPDTKDYKLSYCDMIVEKAKYDHHLKGVVEKATVFISHAWKYKLLDVLDALANHFKDELDKIVWFDLVSNNQHKATTLDFNWWATTFMNAIGQFGHTVMILAPWNNPIPYQRAWCIFEAYCTIVTGAKFEIALSAEERKVFMQECKAGPTQVLNKMLSIVDSENSDASTLDEKIQIHKVIRNEVGFTKINSMLFKQMHDWVLKVSIGELAKAEARADPMDELNSKNLFKQMHDWVLKVSIGELAKAEARADPMDELDSKNLVATLYHDQGAYKEALPLLKDCLAKREVMLGKDHPDTLVSMSALAEVYENIGKYDLAEPLYKHTLEKRETMLGDSHPLTLASMSNLAGLHHLQGKFSDAESLYKICLAKIKKTLGSDHPTTLACLNNLALVYYKQDKYDDAEKLLNKCQSKKISVLGPDHQETLISENNIALLYSSKGKYDEAEQKYKRCVGKCEMMFGPNHPDTLTSENNFAGLYLNQGRYEEAESLYKEILSKSVSHLGSDHPLTLTVSKNLSNCKTVSSN
ncbi:TPR-like protein [Chaetoceros tenuissimus]|uniref:TPR-like protein n=1 Tax=Chaetoceros tenuissimus TaxID=426638 RepID=A0AAD3HFI4_9STRA|nr:TPR-like protein [Chaetoceros tenuissimus]